MFGWSKVLKGRSYYTFDYKPRYYDERKERLEKIKKKYENSDTTTKNVSEENNDYVTIKKGQLRNTWKKTKTSGDYNSTIRIAIIVAILFGIAAYILRLS
ncbi:hypothetical protein EV195_10677 [Tenacibaculum skagerrakense]|uniref:Uncharacterized protein n=1 Tax=Tenacibaculum skagerrakense TaxID=186571 RepID=A0A4R2NSC5_9FLAO|nr:hypothetical protein [Tenacibaculum skagerrakense]TCP24275.1 hypothetical protein EV195_10677 [Tenacibaculum skagerrakense]